MAVTCWTSGETDCSRNLNRLHGVAPPVASVSREGQMSSAIPKPRTKSQAPMTAW
jgi:hypothetical protein